MGGTSRILSAFCREQGTYHSAALLASFFVPAVIKNRFNSCFDTEATVVLFFFRFVFLLFSDSWRKDLQINRQDILACLSGKQWHKWNLNWLLSRQALLLTLPIKASLILSDLSFCCNKRAENKLGLWRTTIALVYSEHKLTVRKHVKWTD